MINLLRGEFYKLQKSKAFYICGIVIVAIVLLMYGSFNLVNKISQGELENGSYGVVVSGDIQETEGSVWSQIGILDIIQLMFTNFGSIISAIFVTLFVWKEYAGGAIKNVIGKGYERWKVFGSKYITVIMASMLLQIIMVAVTVLLGSYFIGTDRLNREFFGNLFRYVGMQLLLGVALTSVEIAIIQICRNLGAGMSVSLCLIIFSTFLTMGLDVVFQYCKWSVKASDYWIIDLITNCPTIEISSSFAIRAVISAILWTMLAFGIGMWHFKRADVK